VAVIAPALPWLRVVAGAPLPWAVSTMLTAQGRGEDPARPWRDLLQASNDEQYFEPTAPAVPAAFVLQWSLESLASAGAYAATLGPFVLTDPAAVSFDLDPEQGFLTTLCVGGIEASPLGRDERLDATRAAYLTLAQDFARTHVPPVTLGLRTRLAMVDDVWAIAAARAASDPVPVQRASCCFIYALPGVHECAGCPRLRPRT
jgi:hypothetical protein